MSGRSEKSRRRDGVIVRPERVIEKSITEQVTGLFTEVVPQMINKDGHYENTDKILWVKFEHCDINDWTQYKKKSRGEPPLVLIIGYIKGLQVWIIKDDGEAEEILYISTGTICCFKLLETPNIFNENLITTQYTTDNYAMRRPLAVYTDNSMKYCKILTVISLKTGDKAETIDLQDEIHSVNSNKRVVVAVLRHSICVMDALNLNNKHYISNCCPMGDVGIIPIALGSDWLAFPDRKLLSVYQSNGGVAPESYSSYKSTAINFALNFSKNIGSLSSIMGRSTSPPTQISSQPNYEAGLVTIVDINKLDESSGSDAGNGYRIIAHFLAHRGKSIACMEFDKSGMLLATADENGHNFHIFKICPHIFGSSRTIVQHLYILHRGDTPARVKEIVFNIDSRWIAVTTQRGTTHVFPITLYGGQIEAATHLSSNVINRDPEESSSGRSTPVHGHVEPKPPVTVEPLMQPGQPYIKDLIVTFTGQSPTNSPHLSSRLQKTSTEELLTTSCVFGSPRGQLSDSAGSLRQNKGKFTCGLYRAGYLGNVVEYTIEPTLPSNAQSTNIPDTSIQLKRNTTAQWSLLNETSDHYGTNAPFNMWVSSSIFKIIDHEEKAPLDRDIANTWMSQVEQLETYHVPNRRIWQGPQFSFEGRCSQNIPICQDNRARYCKSPMSGSEKDYILVNVIAQGEDGHKHRFVRSHDSESEESVQSKISNDLKEAMKEDNVDTGVMENLMKLGEKSVFEITCDPPGHTVQTMETEPFQMEDLEAKFQETIEMESRFSEDFGRSSISPLRDDYFYRKDTPSLEDSKGLTSSAEELAATLSRASVESPPNFEPSSCWKPIDPPLPPTTVETKVERPMPVRDEMWRAETNVENILRSCDDESSEGIEPRTQTENKKKKLTSASSEDDFTSVRETKKDRRKKKKRTAKDSDDSSSKDSETVATICVDAKEKTIPPEIDINKTEMETLDHFHSAKEFHDLSFDDYHTPSQKLEDLEMPSDDEKPAAIFMDSIYDQNDLALALQEASSDEGKPVKVEKSVKTSESFPFRDTSSDDEGKTCHVRRRGPQSYEEETSTTSGDDRKATSESDVTNSPNPRAGGAKGRRKKKKKN